TVLRQAVPKIMAIDDLADRRHDCDLLLDQNLYLDAQRRYSEQVPHGSRLLLGPSYALLREEFAEARRGLRLRTGHVNRILVSLGGIDQRNHTRTVLDALIDLNAPEIAVDVVIGSQHPQRDQLAE